MSDYYEMKIGDLEDQIKELEEENIKLKNEVIAVNKGIRTLRNCYNLALHEIRLRSR